MISTRSLVRLFPFFLPCSLKAWLLFQVSLLFGPLPILGATPRISPAAASVPGIQTLEVDLGGVWQFNPDPEPGFWQSGGSAEHWTDIAVPGEWAMQGFQVAQGVGSGYLRSFRVPVDWKGKRVKLVASSVYSDAQIWVNGQSIGRHVGAFVPFEFDITEALRPGADNRIALRVINESAADAILKGTTYAQHPLGGINRPLRLRVLPTVNVASLHVRTLFDDAYENAELVLELKVANERDQNADNLDVAVELFDPAGNPVSLTVPPESMTVDAHGYGTRKIRIPVARPQHWNAETPHLYRLVVALQMEGTTVQTVERRVGFREVEVQGQQLRVNGVPVKLRGTCRWDTHSRWGRSVPADLAREDLLRFKQANMNFIRTSHCPATRDILDACDEMGLYVMEEAPACWVKPSRKGDQLPMSEKEEAVYLHAVRSMLERDRSHPCILIWSLANESAWQPAFDRASRWVKERDPGRLRIFCSQQGVLRQEGLAPFPVVPEDVDLSSRHYPGMSLQAEGGKSYNRMVFTEYAHVGRHNELERIIDPGLNDHYDASIDHMWNACRRRDDVVGAAIWCGVDELFFVKDQWVGYGRWGTLDEWRRRKTEYWHTRKAYSPVEIEEHQVLVRGADGRIQIPVENHYSYLNLNQLEVRWEAGTATGVVEVDVEPRRTGVIRIDLPNDLDADALTLTFHHPRGWLVDAYRFAFAGAREMVAASAPEPLPFSVTETAVHLVVTVGSATWTFDRSSGKIVSAVQNGETILIGGPHVVATPVDKRKGVLTDPKAMRFQQSVYPLQEAKMEWTGTGEEVILTLTGKVGRNEATIHLALTPTAELKVEYSFTGGAQVREAGLAFDVAPSCEYQTWQRDGYWSWYPEDHIGRNTGTARAFYGERPEHFTHPLAHPGHAWSQDDTPWGSNDFRASRRKVQQVTLHTADGVGIRFDSDGAQTTRAVVDTDRIRFLLLDYLAPTHRSWDGRKAPSQAKDLTTTPQTGTLRLSLVGARPLACPPPCGP